MPIFQIQNRKLFYKAVPDALPADTVFVHGYLGNHLWWESLVRELKQNYQGERSPGQAVTVDWLGHGQSSEPEEIAHVGLASLARDLVDLIETLPLEQIKLVTHGEGFLLALMMLEEKPELLERLLALSPIVPKNWSSQDTYYKTLKDMLASEAVFKQQLKEKFWAQTEGDDGLVDMSWQTSALFWQVYSDSFESVDVESHLQKIAQPVTMLRGEQDPFVAKTTVKGLVKHLTNGEYRELAGMGHTPQISHPQKVAGELVSFLYN